MCGEPDEGRNLIRNLTSISYCVLFTQKYCAIPEHPSSTQLLAQKFSLAFYDNKRQQKRSLPKEGRRWQSRGKKRTNTLAVLVFGAQDLKKKEKIAASNVQIKKNGSLSGKTRV